MKIRELQLKNFGKFEEEKRVLKDGINLFYGENESGKTTMHTFIKCMLFGLERGRGRASINDTYKIYEPWKNPNYYAGVLKFESGGKQFCLERNFDRYQKSARLVCEDDGEEFSLEHGDLEMLLGGLTASNYENTVAIGQMKVETNQSLAVELQNFATNYYATGHSEMDLEGALLVLSKKKKELEKEMRRLQQKNQEQYHDVEQEATYVWRELQQCEQELQRIEVQLEAQTMSRKKTETDRPKDILFHPAGVVLMLFALFMAWYALHSPWNYLVMIVLALAEGIYLWNRLKEGKHKKRQSEEVLEGQVEEKLRWQRERLQQDRKEKQIQYDNLQERLQEMTLLGAKHKGLEFQRQAVELAMERMAELAKEVQQDFSTILNQKASAILCAITGGKYQMLLVDEKLKMSLYTGERKIALEQVSRGTIEQIYFALRMAISEILHEEELPVICDDTFVFYDDRRLEHTLRWLSKHRKQVILFTCQKREGELLNKMGIPFA